MTAFQLAASNTLLVAPVLEVLVLLALLLIALVPEVLVLVAPVLVASVLEER